MKQNRKAIAIGIAICILSITAFSQEQVTIPRWVTEKGFWVVESNINAPLTHNIFFYNNEEKLVYREQVTGMKLNPAKRKVKMKLKKVLENSVALWEERKITEENKHYVTAILK